MNLSIREQLVALFNRRNEAVHGNKDVVFSRYFLQVVEQYDLDLAELRTLLIRGMRPGKAIRRVMEARLKSNAQDWADREGLKGSEREDYIKGFLRENGGAYLDGTVKELTDAFQAKATAQEVLFAEDPEDIRFVYANGPQSCMVDSFASEMAGLAYGFSPNLAVAYRENEELNGRITARTLVNTATRKYGRVYGDEADKLCNGLGELGYEYCEEDSESPAEGELLFVPLIRKLDKRMESWHWRWVDIPVYTFSQTYHPPYIDWSDALIATDRSGWVKAFGKKWYGRWMRPFKYWSEDYINAQARQGWTVLKNRWGEDIQLELDEVPEVWEFHSHASEATPMDDEDSYFRRIWSNDPYLKYGKYDQ